MNDEEEQNKKLEEIVKCPYCLKLFTIEVGLELIKEKQK